MEKLKMEETIGGIGLKDVIKFQMRIMLGTQYDKVKKATKEEDIIVACLRVAWNDAFRHVSRNQWNNDSKKTKEINKLADEYKISGNTVDDKLNQYIVEKILHPTGRVYETFKEYVKAQDSKSKGDVIRKAIKEGLLEEFKEIKNIKDNKKPLCFGHIQKLFAMAVKYYVCIYICKDNLELNANLKIGEIIKKEDLENADCPIDSIILKCLDKKLEEGKFDDSGYELEKGSFSSFKWSKLGTNNYPDDKYEIIQNTVSDMAGNNRKLYFDFTEWG